MCEESLNASATSSRLNSRLLLGRYRVQAMVEIDGAIPGQHLLEICLERAFALPHLLGPPLLGRLAIFGSNLVGIDEGLRAGGSRHGERKGGDDNELFQMSLRKRLILALGRRELNGKLGETTGSEVD